MQFVVRVGVARETSSTFFLTYEGGGMYSTGHFFPCYGYGCCQLSLPIQQLEEILKWVLMGNVV